MRPARGTLILLLCALAAPARAEEGELKVGDAAPTFSLRTLNPELAKRRVVGLRSFVGPGAEEPKKAIVLSFAASYCEPCKKELRALKTEEPALRAGGVLTLVVVIDTEEEGAEKMKRLVVDELKLELPVLSDRFAILARRYRAEKLPFVVLIDADGVVRWTHAGYDLKALKAALAALG